MKIKPQTKSYHITCVFNIFQWHSSHSKRFPPGKNIFLWIKNHLTLSLNRHFTLSKFSSWNIKYLIFNQQVAHTSPWWNQVGLFCFLQHWKAVDSLAIPALQVEMRVEVDEDLLLWLGRLDQPGALLVYRVTSGVTGRGHITGVRDGDLSTTGGF